MTEQLLPSGPTLVRSYLRAITYLKAHACIILIHIRACSRRESNKCVICRVPQTNAGRWQMYPTIARESRKPCKNERQRVKAAQTISGQTLGRVLET